MQEFIIRSATLEDAKAVLELENQCFETDKISKRQVKYLLKNAKAINLVAELNTQIAACAICLLPAHPRPARLYSIAVNPECRGRGFARHLIIYLLSALSGMGYQRCRLEVRQSQLKLQILYRELGFDEINHLPHYYQDGESAIQMEASL